jgi:hypothetical protein
MPVNLKNQKEEKRAALVRSLGLQKTVRAIVLSYIQDVDIALFMMAACDAIGVGLVTSPDSASIEGADAYITDILDDTVPMATLIEHAVVPIVPSQSSYSAKLSEFNPMKFEGNAFLFDPANQFQMFAALVRYLENVRYPGDKRTLVKNVSETQI